MKHTYSISGEAERKRKIKDVPLKLAMVEIKY